MALRVLRECVERCLCRRHLGAWGFGVVGPGVADGREYPRRDVAPLACRGPTRRCAFARACFHAVGISVPEFMAWWDTAWSVVVSSFVGVFLYSFIFVPMVQ